MGLKLFGPGGIDQKSNSLLRDPRNLRDARNIQYSSAKEYEKRSGTDHDSVFVNSYTDVIFIKSMNQYFFRDGSDYSIYSNGVKRTIPKFIDPTTDGDTLISSDEYLNTFIFTHITDQVATAVYDSSSIYRAGLPTPNTQPTGSGSTYFMLSFFEFIDAKGNTIYGPATINKDVSSGSFSTTFDTLLNGGFCASYLRTTVSTTPIVLNSTSRTISYDTKSADIVVGGKVVFRDRGATIVISDLALPTREVTDDFIILEVESVDTIGKTITFTAASFGTKQISIALTSGLPVIANVHGGCVLRVLFSPNEVTEYTTEQSYLNGFLVDNSAAQQTVTISLDTNVRPILLSDFYDITTSKLRPPNCSFVKVFGEQLVCGNVSSFYDFTNKEIKYTNNDLIMYSDLSTGDIGFNFSEINRQLIGDTYDGQISGLTRSKDSMIVFKNTSVYALDGILIPGQYGLRKIETNEIGCLSHKSILSVDGLVMFQGQDGIYAINGYTCKKVSTPLDPFFIAVDPSFTRSVMYNLKDKYIFFTDMGVVVFDYEYKEWFIWDGITANCGLTVDNNRNIKLFNSNYALDFISDKKDFNPAFLSNPLLDEYLPIGSYIKTTYFDLGEPSLLKKTVEIRIFSLNNAGQTLSLSHCHDWTESNLSQVDTVDMSSADTRTILKKISIQQAQSISFVIENNIINEDMDITGYEIGIEVVQRKDKNVK